MDYYVAKRAQVKAPEDWLIQPIAVANVGEVLVDVATSDQGDAKVAGPEQIRLSVLTKLLLEATGDSPHGDRGGSKSACLRRGCAAGT